MATAGELLERLVADPGRGGLGRLAMRTPTVPCPDAATAATHEPADSPWWRSLDGEWDFELLRSPGELTDAHVGADGPAAGGPVAGGRAERVMVPGSWTTQGPRSGGRWIEPHYTNVVMPFDTEPPAVPTDNPVGVYRRRVTVPAEWRNRRVVLRVGAAESLLAVWVDGRFVGAGTDSRLPSEFDLTGLVRPGRRCVITLVVARWCAHTWLEDQDQWWHGGIQRSVTLASTAHSHLADVTAHPGLRDGTGTLELVVRVDGPVRRERGWSVEVAVTTLGTPSRPVGKRVAVHREEPAAWDHSSEAAQLIGGMFVEPGVVRAQLEVPDARPWSHEDPYRYRLLVTLRDPDGHVAEVAALHTGFRSIEVADNELRINGAPVLIHGVNLHEHDPDTGRAVTAERTRADLVAMKAHNLNAVRAAHYPHDEHLAELCDELGLYLIDEANVESHGRQASLCHDPNYAGAVVERVERMVRRDDHHPSIIAWSLGNESGDGAAHAAAAAWVRHHDPTRPLHYEGPLMHDLYADAPVTDIVAPMYTPLDEIVAWARSGRDPRRPLIMCEYSHAMGNSNGSLADHWDAFESVHGLQGGFIWEWLDHGLRPGDEVGRGPGGRTAWRYGGDFGDAPNDANFVCDGLVSPEREPHPAMREVHHVGRPVRVEWADAGRRRLRISNRRWFGDLADLRCRWELTVDGDVRDSGELDVPALGARSSVIVVRPVRAPRAADDAEVHLTLRWTLRRRTPWAPAGHEVGHDQLVLRAPSAARRSAAAAATERASVTERAAATEPSVETMPAVDRMRWAPTLWRALTDNDGLRQGWMRGHLGHLDRWVDRQGLDHERWDAASGELRAPGVDEPVTVHRSITAHADGWHRVEIRLDVPEPLADPPRLGTRWELPGDLDRAEWFGDGPHECYPDRRAATVVGRWSSSVDDLYTDYVLPQEHGHRTGVRWFALRAGSAAPGSGLIVVADPDTGDGTIGATARRHSDADLWASRHTDELARRAAARPMTTWLFLDVAQRGLGTASCGPDTLEAYRIPGGTHRLVTWWRGFRPAHEDPGVLASAVRHHRV